MEVLQYMLTVLSEFYPDVPPVEQDGVYGDSTRRSVMAFQQHVGLPATGAVDSATWTALYRAYEGIRDTVMPFDGNLFPLAAFAGEPAQPSPSTP